jgi:hypothetical protein
MNTIDEIGDLRAEVRHSYLTGRERKEAETRLAELIRERDQRHMEQERFD